MNKKTVGPVKGRRFFNDKVAIDLLAEISILSSVYLLF